MNIETKFKVGDTVYTINAETLKIRVFEVGIVTTYTNEKGATSVTLYPKDGSSFDGADESKCFTDRQSLIDHITEK